MDGGQRALTVIPVINDDRYNDIDSNNTSDVENDENENEDDDDIDISNYSKLFFPKGGHRLQLRSSLESSSMQMTSRLQNSVNNNENRSQARVDCLH